MGSDTGHTLPPRRARLGHTRAVTRHTTDPVLHPAERTVWDLLVRTLGPDDVLLANVRFTGVEQDHEIDLIALLPGAGVVVVEVKGGAVTTDEQGRWWQVKGQDRHPIDPVNQVLRGKHVAHDYVEKDPRWADSSRTRVRWAHAVVTPHSTVPDDFGLPDCPRTMISGKTDLPHLATRLRALTEGQETRHRRPTRDDVGLIQQILAGRRPMDLDLMAEADERADRAERLTQEQAMLLDVTRLLPRVEVRGGAGSGKTLLAITQAKKLTRGGGGVKSQRVALLCYSYGLASYFERVFAREDHRRTPAFHGTFEELGARWGISTSDRSRDESDFWERDLPQAMAERAEDLAQGHKFDAIIVDEAQDFADSWWTPLLAALRDPDTGGLYAYSDENQRVFARFGRPPVPLVPLLLDHNLRNTRQIAASFDPLAPMRMRPRGEDGPEVTFVPAARDEAVSVAEDQVLALLEEGWPADQVALITTGARHPTQARLQDQLGQAGYWATFWEARDVFYGHVLGCKGLERRAVVLCLNETGERDRYRERLYVGMSRATDRLVVVGDPGVVRSMGGDEVARRLGLG